MKKINRSEVMTLAHRTYEAGNYTWSEALKKTWALTKIDILEQERFMLNMADFMSYSEKARCREISWQIHELNQQLNPAPIIVPPTEEEKAYLDTLLVYLLNEPDDTHWNCYGTIESRRIGKINAIEAQAAIAIVEAVMKNNDTLVA